jgi:hypothetical protein
MKGGSSGCIHQVIDERLDLRFGDANRTPYFDNVDTPVLNEAVKR